MEALPLACLREMFPAWHIIRNIPGMPDSGFTAIERKTGHRITASALGELADLLETASKADSH